MCVNNVLVYSEQFSAILEQAAKLNHTLPLSSGKNSLFHSLTQGSGEPLVDVWSLWQLFKLFNSLGCEGFLKPLPLLLPLPPFLLLPPTQSSAVGLAEVDDVDVCLVDGLDSSLTWVHTEGSGSVDPSDGYPKLEKNFELTLMNRALSILVPLESMQNLSLSLSFPLLTYLPAAHYPRDRGARTRWPCVVSVPEACRLDSPVAWPSVCRWRKSGCGWEPCCEGSGSSDKLLAQRFSLCQSPPSWFADRHSTCKQLQVQSTP